MYSQDEINSAVGAGALSQEAADALRAHVAIVRERPVTDEEHFRLINSFNDIFVAIGIVILLVAVGAIGQAIGGAIIPKPAWPDNFESFGEAETSVFYDARARSEALQICIAGLLVALASWPLAEFFTRRRRMALPSILLLIAFVVGLFAAFSSFGMLIARESAGTVGALFIAGAGLLAAGGAWLHWRRFAVPITVAAGAGALAVTVIALIGALLEATIGLTGEDWLLPFILVAGLAIFVLAMRWDISDPVRETRRADVAFWLHLLAAPMIAHPVFFWLGGVDGGESMGIGGALGVMAVYVVFGLVALAIDRRALLVSALAYVLIALGYLFDQFGAVQLAFALTALVIGSALLSLSAFWTPIRAKVVAALPEKLQARLPRAAVAANLAAT